MAEQYSIVYMCHIFFIHSSVDGHLRCFHVLAIESPFLAPFVPLLSMVPAVSNPEPLLGSAWQTCSLLALACLRHFFKKIN